MRKNYPESVARMLAMYFNPCTKYMLGEDSDTIPQLDGPGEAKSGERAKMMSKISSRIRIGFKAICLTFARIWTIVFVQKLRYSNIFTVICQSISIRACLNIPVFRRSLPSYLLTGPAKPTGCVCLANFSCGLTCILPKWNFWPGST